MKSLPPDRILHRCGTDRWYSVHTMDAHGEEVACVRRRAWMAAAAKPLSAGHLSAGAAVSAPQCGDAGSGSGVLPAVHDLSPADLYQLPAGPAAAGCGTPFWRRLEEFLPREVVSFIGMYLTYVGREPQRAAAAVRPVLLPVLPHAGHQHADALRADRLSPGPAPGRAAASW